MSWREVKIVGWVLFLLLVVHLSARMFLMTF